MTDPISDMLTRIRNAQAVKKAEAIVPFSNMKAGIAAILKDHGYLESFETVKAAHNPALSELKLVLRYKEANQPAIMGIKRVSKPSRRVYVAKNDLPNVLNHLGIAIISTSQGLMTNKEAKKRKLGGEVICEVF